MKFNKYSAIYRNDDVIINDESVIGKVKDIKEYFRYELASQCMSTLDKNDYENFIDNCRLILDFIETLEYNDEDDDNKIIVKVHPMGSLYYDDYEEPRTCSECGKDMTEGYCIENGLEYYCSDECLHKHYTDEEYNELYDDGNGDSYYTEWEID